MELDLEKLVVFKLMNGEVIICEMVSEDEQQVTIRYAIQALETIVNGEVPLISFVQWVPFTDDLIILYRHGILAVAPPSDTIKQLYVQKMTELETEEVDVTSIEEDAFRHQCRNPAFCPK